MQSLVANGFTWIFSVDADESDLHVLQQKYGFHTLDIEDCLSDNERPKVEEYDDYLFCVIHVPVRIGNRIVKSELNVFLGKDFIVTLGDSRLQALLALWMDLGLSHDKHEEYMGKGSGFFFYKILDLLFDAGFPMIESMMKELRRIETDLFENEDGQLRVLRDILNLKRNTITMRSILFPQRAVVAVLQHKKKELIPDEMGIYFDDVSDAIERQWSLLETAKEMSEALQDTHESWLGHRTNSVVRILTIFSVTMLPLTFLTGLYGMNIELPFQHDPQMFSFLMSGMFGIVAILLGYFAWKKWL